MENNEKVVAKVDNVSVSVVGKVSKGGKPYTVVCMNIAGKKAQFFLTSDIELAMLHAGVKFNY